MSAVTQYASPVAIVRTYSHVAPWSQLTANPASEPRRTWFGFAGLIQYACWSTVWLPQPSPSSICMKVRPPSSDLAARTFATYSTFALVGSTRRLLKYIGRPLQLLTSVHDRPLFSER